MKNERAQQPIYYFTTFLREKLGADHTERAPVLETLERP